MADGSVNINLKLNADDSGAKKASASLKGVAAEAKKSASSTIGDLGKVQGAVGKISGAFGALKNALTGFGIGAVIGTITGAVNKLGESFGASKKNAEDFAAIQARLGQEKGIANLANDYAKMSDAIAKAADAQNHALEMIDLEVAGRRKLADAKADAAKEDEIAALDTNAKDYAEQLDRIEKKYAALKASRDAGNAVEDLVLVRQKMNAQADQLDDQAAANDKATEVLKKQLSQAKREKSKAEIGAVDLNENDKTDTASAIGKTLGQLFTGDWGRMAGATTAEGDAVRKENAQKVAELELKIQQLEEQIRQSGEKSAALRTEAEQTRERAEAVSPQIEAAEIAGSNSRRLAARGEETSQKALVKKQGEISAEAAKTEDAKRAAALLTQQQAQLKAQIAQQQAAKTSAAQSAYSAQNAYDLSVANGAPRRDQSAALQNLQSAQGAAQEVAASADGAIAALIATLKSVEARLKAAQTYLQNQNKQNQNAWGDAPAGS